MITLTFVSFSVAGDGGFDHGHGTFGAFLQGAVDGVSVDYALLQSRRGLLERYLDEVAEVEVSSFTAPQKLALYVNAYNAYTIDLVLDAGLPKSIRDLDGGKVWDTRTYRVAKTDLTLNQMEHDKARALADGRVHAVLNCASKGCPPLPPAPLTATGQEGQLDAAARRWAATNAFRVDGDTVRLNPIFDWYGEDFADARKGDLPNVDGEAEAALWFLARYADAPGAATLTGGKIITAWMEYDWALNRK
jgi:hypothetical protein